MPVDYTVNMEGTVEFMVSLGEPKWNAAAGKSTVL